MTCHCPLVELWVKSFFGFSRRFVWLQGLRSTWESFLKSKINELHSDPILWFELCLARKRGSLPDLTLKGAVRKGATQRWQRSFESQTCMVCSRLRQERLRWPFRSGTALFSQHWRSTARCGWNFIPTPTASCLILGWHLPESARKNTILDTPMGQALKYLITIGPCAFHHMLQCNMTWYGCTISSIKIGAEQSVTLSKQQL